MKNRTYRYFTGKPLYPFGYGLSYSSFQYSDLTVRVLPDPYGIDVTAKVTNTSAIAGDEVPQLYLSYPDAASGPNWNCAASRGYISKRARAKRSTSP